MESKINIYLARNSKKNYQRSPQLKKSPKQYLLDSRKVQYQHSLPATRIFEQALSRFSSLFQRAAFRRVKSHSNQITPESGNSAPKYIFSNSSIHKNFVDIRELGKSASCWPSKVFSGKLEETDKRSFHFEGSSGISNTPIIRTHSIFFPFRSSNETGETDSCRSGDRKNVWKTINTISTALKRLVSKHPFPSHQKTQDIVQWSIWKSWIGASHMNTSKWKVYFFWKKFSRRTIIRAR